MPHARHSQFSSTIIATDALMMRITGISFGSTITAIQCPILSHIIDAPIINICEAVQRTHDRRHHRIKEYKGPQHSSLLPCDEHERVRTQQV